MGNDSSSVTGEREGLFWLLREISIVFLCGKYPGYWLWMKDREEEIYVFDDKEL